MDIEYTSEEIAAAQRDLDLYPNASSFWDTDSGQETMRIARQYSLESTNTNRERCKIHAEMMADHEEYSAWCARQDKPREQYIPIPHPGDIDY